MVVLGYLIIILAYGLSFLPDTIVSVALVVTGGLSCVIAAAYFFTILMPKMNVNGILAGYVGGMLPILFRVVVNTLSDNHFTI